MTRSGDPQGQGYHVTLRRTDTRKMPVAMKQADKEQIELERGIPTPIESLPLDHFCRGGKGGHCMLALNLQNHHWESPALPLSSWPALPQSSYLPNGYISFHFIAWLPGGFDEAALSMVT